MGIDSSRMIESMRKDPAAVKADGSGKRSGIPKAKPVLKLKSRIGVRKRIRPDFHSVPFSKRIILLPHCLRNSRKCRAKDTGYRYVCVKCGACPISAIMKEAESLGYRDVYILKGGRAIRDIVKNGLPEAILGIACDFEGKAGVRECAKAGIPVCFVPLARDGCSNTEVDMKALMREMGKTTNRETG